MASPHGHLTLGHPPTGEPVRMRQDGRAWALLLGDDPRPIAYGDSRVMAGWRTLAEGWLGEQEARAAAERLGPETVERVRAWSGCPVTVPGGGAA